MSSIINYILIALIFSGPYCLFAETTSGNCDGSCGHKLEGVNEDVIVLAKEQQGTVDKILSEVEMIKERARRKALDNKYLSECLSKYSGSKKSKKQHYDFTLSCGPGYERIGTTNYSLELDNGLLTAKLKGKYFITYKDKVSLPKFLNAMKCTQKKLSNYGIYLDYNFIDGDEYLGKPEAKNRFQLFLNDKPGMHDQVNWYTKSGAGRVIPPDELCSLTAHEMLHRLGLYDLYEDGNCSNGPFYRGDESNIMEDARQSIKTAKISEDQINHIVRPICEPENFPNEGYIKGIKKFIYTPKQYDFNDGGVLVPKS
ncbi:MAG: hypothetical protein H6622_11615 [Halobacteriovoraceae bacterium]|nr:hypothetical protein [Halobacteriovoraceae bacterium]